LAEVTHEMIERYQAVMDGLVDIQVVGGDDLRMWLAKFSQPTHAKTMPARALRPSLG
jgi:hypothetical protein